ncbi:hypothetical protein [Pseudomonas sp.]|jgi:hypothetical protein|uniref:hypothetical protein n=1 Tax=Pseudomonas sp. TaxID=306 RepID=UPI002EDBAA00
MINSAEEFVALRDSEIKAEYDRSAMEEAPVAVWHDVIERFPDHRQWVAHNKTVPVEVLEVLCDFDADTRWFVACKRKLSYELFERLSKDADTNVRIAISVNKKTPLGILEKLFQDVDEEVAHASRDNYDARRNTE